MGKGDLNMTCSLFGHRYADDGLSKSLKNAIIDMIEKYNVDKFYVGNNGEFDRLAVSVLNELLLEYDFTHYIVLAYFFETKDEIYSKTTIYPEGLELVHKRYAISARNNWMVDNSDCIICYVWHDGGACKAMKRAENQGKKIINIA